jgi:hypothetical protein
MRNLKVNLYDAKKLAVFYMSIGLMPFLHSTYGIGKSSIVHEIADENNLKLIDKRLSQEESVDLKGYPDKLNGRATYLPPDDIPLEGDELPIKYMAIKKGQTMLYGPKIGQPADKDYPEVRYDGWLLFLDEMNSATDEVQAAAYKITLDRKVGQRNVHEACAMIAAGNLETDNGIVNQMATPLATRMVHIVIDNSLEAFMKFAAKIRMDSRITAFLNWKPSYLHDHAPDSEDPTRACNRTWEFADRVIKNKPVDDPLFVHAMAGAITEAKAMEFHTYTQVFATLPKYQEILDQPSFVNIPSEPGTLWAMLGVIGDAAQPADMPKLMNFIVRLPKEHQVVLMLDIGRKNKACTKVKEAAIWCQHNANVVFD